MNEGVISGAFKGFALNFAQFGLVLYPSVYFANKNGSDSKFLTFLSTYTFLDALFYPLDSLKSILYADTLGRYCNSSPIQPSRQSPPKPTFLTFTEVSPINCSSTCQFFPESTALLRSDPKPKPCSLGWQLSSSTP